MPLFGRQVTLGIVANEFFDPAIGRTGGFGWAARAVARVFRDPELGVRVVFMSGEHQSRTGETHWQTDSVPLLLRQGFGKRLSAIRAARSTGVDLMLTIDYRYEYDYWLWNLPRTPAVVWSRDPRTAEDVAWINTLRIPDQQNVEPLGIGVVDCTGVARVARLSKAFNRKILIAGKTHHTASKAPATYGLPQSAQVLPNPDILDYRRTCFDKAPHPRVAFVGRLDPIKRPWLYFELARAFPHVEFLVLGRAHFTGQQSWQPASIPANVRLLGQVDGEDKLRALASSWVLVNTSIHEETPVSVLEGFACEVPVLSCTDWGDLAVNYGVFAGRCDGTGMGALPALTNGLDRILTDHGWRMETGRRAREWVTGFHNTPRFLSALKTLFSDAGVPGIGTVADVQ